MSRVVDLGKLRQPKQRPAVAVGIPMTEVVPRTAFWNFAFMFAELNPKRDRIMPIHQTATPGDARNILIRDFLSEGNQQFLLLLDSDMKPPANIVELLTRYDLPFVSGYCTRKTYPYLPIPSMLAGTHEQQGETIYDYAPISNWEPDSGIRACDGVGAAALCLRRDLLEAVGDPWFKHEGGGEDYYFCRKVKAAGADIWVDTGCCVGHIGEHVADPRDFFNVKDQYLAEIGEREVTLRPTGPERFWRAAPEQEAI